MATAAGSSQQNVSKHLGVLHAESFVASRKRGTSSLYRVADPSANELCEIVIRGIGARLADHVEALGEAGR